MVDDYIILPRAAKDADEAYRWYENRSPGLGRRFLDRLQQCIDSIRRTPKAFVTVVGEYRKALVKQFPYVVFYKYADDTITSTPFSTPHRTQPSG